MTETRQIYQCFVFTSGKLSGILSPQLSFLLLIFFQADLLALPRIMEMLFLIMLFRLQEEHGGRDNFWSGTS